MAEAVSPRGDTASAIGRTMGRNCDEISLPENLMRLTPHGGVDFHSFLVPPCTRAPGGIAAPVRHFQTHAQSAPSKPARILEAVMIRTR